MSTFSTMIPPSSGTIENFHHFMDTSIHCCPADTFHANKCSISSARLQRIIGKGKVLSDYGYPDEAYSISLSDYPLWKGLCRKFSWQCPHIPDYRLQGSTVPKAMVANVYENILYGSTNGLPERSREKYQL